MNHRPTSLCALLLASGVLLSGCAYLDFQRGAYESIRSRDTNSSAYPPGAVRQTLPPYDEYERERAKAKGSSSAPSSSASAAQQ